MLPAALVRGSGVEGGRALLDFVGIDGRDGREIARTKTDTFGEFKFDRLAPSSGRYRVEGKAYRQFVNNQASGFGRSGQEFEMLIQTRDRKQPEIVEIRIK